MHGAVLAVLYTVVGAISLCLVAVFLLGVAMLFGRILAWCQAVPDETKQRVDNVAAAVLFGGIAVLSSYALGEWIMRR